MSDLTFNKIAGAVLATGLAIVGLGELSNIVFEPAHVEKAGYEIAGVEAEAEGGGGPVADVIPDWGTVLPTANIEAGKAVAAKCASCHSFESGGPNGTGPDLFGVVGRKPGSHGGFSYSAAMTDFAASHAQWDYDRLYEFLKSPQKDIPGTKMTFIGLKKPEDRIAVIAYLHSLGSTLPVPAPKPAAAAPAAGAAPAGEAPVTPGGEVPPAASSTAGTPAPNAAPSAPAPAQKH